MTEEDKTGEDVTGEGGGCEKSGGNVTYVVSCRSVFDHHCFNQNMSNNRIC